ncbi:MAG TPA: hypothetical protein VK166_10825 [Chitinophagaceae bacterium]|nr:hypothetical protein [Chitinophagaceae bacterium]
MKEFHAWKLSFCPILLLLALSLSAQKNTALTKTLAATYDLVPAPAKDTQYYEMHSVLQKHAPDGTITSTDTYNLYLRCVPSRAAGKGDEYTCLKFTMVRNNSKELSIPALSNWTYYYRWDDSHIDSAGQVFGIDHAKFEGIKDETGNELPVENRYHVYNAFIDFHAMGVFAGRTPGDSGIQSLRRIGDKVVHIASFSQPPVNLGKGIARGSYFRNGEVTLLFKGLGLVNNKNCALIEYDSGKSSFLMLTKFGDKEMPTKGSSHYWGDIYKDLAGGWIQKANLHELVVSETTVPGMSAKVSVVVERTISIQNTDH